MPTKKAKTPKTSTFAPLDVAQLVALQAFALQHAARWKAELGTLWMRGGASPELHRLRNTHGPEWLATFDLDASMLAVELADSRARDVLVAVFAAVQNGPDWTLHVLTRKLGDTAHPAMAARTAAMRRAVQLGLVVSDGDLSAVGHALIELVATERRDAKREKSDSRGCFGVEWYRDELDAEARGFHVRNHRINGGFRDGERCGRDQFFDYDDGAMLDTDGKPMPLGCRLYAVVVP